jgi:hypothetical protein
LANYRSGYGLQATGHRGQSSYHHLMDVSELRKRIVRALDDARKEAAARRANVDRASASYERFLSDIATPLFLQAANVLKAQKLPFTAQTPAGAVRLVSDHASQEFIELELDASAPQPQVIGRSSLRGRAGIVVEERPVAPGKSIDELTEDDVSQFLIAEIRRVVSRS